MSHGAEKRVRMANQIAAEFEHHQGANGADATWDNLWHFWEPRAREAIVAHLDGGCGISATAAAAAGRLRHGGAPTPQTRATEFTVDADGSTEGDAG